MNPEFLREAFELARQGRGLASPNPLVGAVLVRHGEVVGRGFHTYPGVAHAEIRALEEAGERASGATLYINMEPCCHQGRTPPCADALIDAKIASVVAAMEDPNPLVAGEGFRRLREAGIEVHLAHEFAAEAEQLNLCFNHFMRTGLPLVTLKSAVTLDGKIAAPDDNQGWITSEVARAHVQELRHESDAIMTGIGTVLGDDCLLTDRTGRPRSRPLVRIVADSLLRLPTGSKMVQSCSVLDGISDLVVATTSAASEIRRKALETAGAKVLTFDGPGGRVDLRKVVRWLATQRCLSLMIEAGSKLNWAALDSGVVDRLFLYYGPKILGGLQSLPMVGGTGRRKRSEAILARNVKLHVIPPDEFAVEGFIVKGT